MTGNKTAVWRNALGQEIVFDNRTFFLESIDMTGTSGIHTVESLAMTDGQVTLGHHLGAKTIPCSFAWKDVRDDRWMQEHLPALFNPLIGGTLTVRTREETYSIDCYPTDVPVFKREAVPRCSRGRRCRMFGGGQLTLWRTRHIGGKAQRETCFCQTSRWRMAIVC